MSKLFIILQNSANTGKTTALNVTKAHIEQLIIAKGIPYTYDLIWQQGQDFRGYFTFGGIKIGISSAGDYRSAVEDGMNVLSPLCDIIIVATRSRGTTVAAAQEIINSSYLNSEVVWLSKEYLTDITHTWTHRTLPPIIGLMAQHTAESITEIIETLRPGTF